MIYLQGRESIAETRRIREQQDLEYLEGLRIDREKAEKAREESKRVEVCFSTQYIKHTVLPMALSSRCLKMQLPMRSESWDTSDSLWGAWVQMPYETSCVL